MTSILSLASCLHEPLPTNLYIDSKFYGAAVPGLWFAVNTNETLKLYCHPDEGGIS